MKGVRLISEEMPATTKELLTEKEVFCIARHMQSVKINDCLNLLQRLVCK